MSKVLVVGGGAAGMLASIAAAKSGHDVTLIEKNQKLGKKLFITGKGRCNFTNASDIDVIFKNINTNYKFLYSAIYTYTNQDIIEYFESIGIKTKIERGNRAFPLSDKSSDIISALTNEIKKLKIEIMYNTIVKCIKTKHNKFNHLLINDDICISGDAVIIATGGLSYPITGSNGDGYEFAKSIGHSLISAEPSLVPLEIKEEECKELQGLSLKNVNASIMVNNKNLYSDFGEMLFTHFGVSGPLILSASCFLEQKMFKNNTVLLRIDLKPALSVEQLDARLLKDFEENKNKLYKNSLDKLLPQKLIPVVIKYSQIPPNKKINEITKSERNQLIKCLKELTFTIAGKRGYNEAIITKGGINVKEIDPSTMESKIIEGVYFAGEVIDVDAMTGGYNLQIAWSTGYLAGTSIK